MCNVNFIVSTVLCLKFIPDSGAVHINLVPFAVFPVGVYSSRRHKILPVVAVENGGRVTVVAAAAETAMEESENRVRTAPAPEVAGRTVGVPSWMSVYEKDPAAEVAALERKVAESIQAVTVLPAGPEKHSVTEEDPGIGDRVVGLTVIVKSGNMKVGPEGDHGGPEADRRGDHPDHEEARGIVGYREAESLVQ